MYATVLTRKTNSFSLKNKKAQLDIYSKKYKSISKSDCFQVETEYNNTGINKF